METPPSVSAGNTSSIVEEARSGGRSWWQACCLGCLLFFVALIVGGIFLVHFLTGSPVEYRTDLPPSFPKDIKLLEVNQASSISYAPGRQKSATLHFVTAPLRWMGDVVETTPGSRGEASKVFDSYGSQIARTDTVTLFWRELKQKPEEVIQYYTTELSRVGFETRTVPGDEVQPQIEFLATRTDATVQATIIPTADTTAIDQLILNITYATDGTN